MSGQVVLEEEFDENYEPTNEEIVDYAKFLGIDPDTEPHLLWIARQSLKAPLPPNWKPCQTDDGNIYYFNFTTGESIWDHPCDEHYRKLYAEEKAKPRNEQGVEKMAGLGSLSARPKLEKTTELPGLKAPLKLGALPAISSLPGTSQPGPTTLGSLAGAGKQQPPIPTLDDSEDDDLSEDKKDNDDWDALSDDDDDDKIIDSVLRGKDLTKTLKEMAPHQNTRPKVNDDDDFDLSLSSEIGNNSHPAAATNARKHQEEDKQLQNRVENEEKRIYENAVRQAKEKTDADIKAFEKQERERFEREKENIRADHEKRLQDQKRKNEEEIKCGLDEHMRTALSEMKRKSADKIAAAQREEDAALDREIQKLQDEHAQKLRTLEDDHRRQYHDREKASKDDQERQLRALKTRNEDELAVALQRETTRHDEKMREMHDSFTAKLEAADRDHRNQLEDAKRAFKQQLDHTIDDSAAIARAEEDHADRMEKFKRRLAESEHEQRQNLELESGTRLRRLREEFEAKERALRKEHEDHMRKIQEDAEKRIKDLKDRVRQREDGLHDNKDLRDQEAAALQSENDRRVAKQEARKRDIDHAESENDRRQAKQEAIKRDLDRLDEELFAREAKLRARRKQINSHLQHPSKADDHHHHRHQNASSASPSKRSRSHRRRSSSRNSGGKKVHLHNDEMSEDDLGSNNDGLNDVDTQDAGEVPRNMLRDLAADVLSAAGQDTGLTEDHVDMDDAEAEESLRFLNTNADSDDSEPISRLSTDKRFEHRSLHNRSASPSTELAKRLGAEENQIRQAKQFLRRQQKNIGARQRELGVAQERWKKEIEEISMHLQRGGIPLNSDRPESPFSHLKSGKTMLRRTDSLDEIEGELGKLLSALKTSISSTRGDAGSSRHNQASRSTGASSYRAQSRAPSQTMSRTPSSRHDSEPASVAVSQHRKRAWEIGHTRTEALLAEHNAWLKGFMARHSGVLSR
ncbi:hypothetical protein PhCBS80983_g03794 [Powellomyces hirtus]|uniref:WW domain-containing protein n=1 Tax=Powellomyces hirtus TaxID=109895 RepID=A0A507E0F4_9FUNG|nr:hypothetical protein PhCBS80983_g03794 [Powellomyces hirtus]